MPTRSLLQSFIFYSYPEKTLFSKLKYIFLGKFIIKKRDKQHKIIECFELSEIAQAYYRKLLDADFCYTKIIIFFDEKNIYFGYELLKSFCGSKDIPSSIIANLANITLNQLQFKLSYLNSFKALEISNRLKELEDY
jgi:hypothetical protein